ncbi:MAG: sugar phosphate isomerase/epimerase [Planctomycetota bacterium]|nr:sugar phosphate isomerase/epimerase [Planctomycetota bacterium]
MQLAIVASALNAEIRAAARQARSLGFEGIQLDVRTAELDITSLSDSGKRELRQVIRSHEIALESLRFDLGSKGFGPAADIDALLSRLQSVLESARALQTPLVCVEAGPLPAPPPELKPKPSIAPEEAGLIIIPRPTSPAPAATNGDIAPQKFDSVFASSVDGAMAELGRRADRYGVMLAFRSDLASFAALERALRAAACPWFGIDFDPVAMLRDEWSAHEIFSRLGMMMHHVRGRDAVAGADRRARPAAIGAGSVNWESLFSLLDEAAYKGWITLDPFDLPDRRAAAVAGADYLKKIRP